MDFELGYCFDKVSLNADSFQTAESTVSVYTSKEPELKGLKTCYKFTRIANS